MSRQIHSVLALFVLAVLALLAIYVDSVQADEAGAEGGEMSAMADAIKYLQGLDKVYGQAARPRRIPTAEYETSTSRTGFGTLDQYGPSYGVGSGSGLLGSKLVRLLQLKQLDRRYDNTLIRPRFGKRGRAPYFDFDDLPVAVRPLQNGYF